MKIFFVYPVTENLNIPVLPIGLASVAAAAEAAGHEVAVFNVLDHDDSHAAMAREIQKFGPDLVGVSARNVDAQDRNAPHLLLGPATRAVEAIRQATAAPVVAGGAGFTMFPDQILARIQADWGIAGMAEDAFLDLADRLENRKPLVGVTGLVGPNHPFDGRIASTPNPDAHPLPLPERHLHIPESWDKNQVFVPVQSRRGCALGCSYCSTENIEGRRLVRRDPVKVAQNVQAFMDAGFGQFFFVDNTFNLPESYALELCGALEAHAPGARWRAIVYPGRLNEDLARRMARAGCVEAALGFEHGSDAMLEGFNKRFGSLQVRQDARLLKDHGIRRNGFLLLGGPGETRQTVKQALDFVDELDLEFLKITTGIRIYPQTPLQETALRKGMIQPDDDLFEPVFYVEPGCESWLDEMVESWKAARPGREVI